MKQFTTFSEANHKQTGGQETMKKTTFPDELSDNQPLD